MGIDVTMCTTPREPVAFGRVQAVTFDVGGTLVVPRVDTATFYQDALRRVGVRRGRATVLKAMASADRALATREAMGTTREGRFAMWDDTFLLAARSAPGPEAWQHACERAGAALPQPNMRLARGARRVLTELRRRGLRLAVISNWSADLPELLTRLGVGEAFEVVLASEAVGIEKPDTRIFVQALSGLGVSASRCVHVGDDPRCDVAAAHQVGMHAVLVDRDGQHTRASCPCVRSLAELLTLLPSHH